MERILIAVARFPTDRPAITQLFRAYAASLPIDLGYQNFDAELASLPGKYAPPTGALLIARAANGVSLGCVAMRTLEDRICEMKRLYVAPEGRGAGLGKKLAAAIIEKARGRLSRDASRYVGNDERGEGAVSRSRLRRDRPVL